MARIVGMMALLVALAVTAFASQDAATQFASLDSKSYAALLGEAYRHDKSNRELNRLVKYYREVAGLVTESQRDHEFGGVVDCIPFEHQPALHGKSGAAIQEAAMLARSAINSKCPSSAAGDCAAQRGYVPSKESVRGVSCKAGTVGVARPVVRMDKDGIPRFVQPVKGGVPQKSKAAIAPAGYAYVDSPTNRCKSGTNSTYTVLGVGSAVGAPVQLTPSGHPNDHIINQGWWIQEPLFGTLKSLEGGWIASSYFTVSPALTIFAFSTPDGYHNGPRNQYNNAGGFISYPGSPALGSSLNEVRYQFRYETMEGQKGFELWLRPFSSTGPYSFGEWIAVGYWPASHYNHPSDLPNFDQYQTGLEIYEAVIHSSVKPTGKIFGWGQDRSQFAVKNNFQDYVRDITFSYGDDPVFEPNAYTAPYYVHFHGTVSP